MSYYTYVINLKKDISKYKNIKKNLDNVGIKFTRFNAIHGKKIGDKYNTIINNKECLPKSLIGCGLSHYIVCKEHFARHKNKIALILEDDAIPLFNDNGTIDKIIKDAPKDWNIILLYTQGITNYKDNTWNTNKYMLSTLAYLINYKGFLKRYPKNYKIWFHTDTERSFTNCKIYKTPKMYFKPDYTTISSTSSSKNNIINFYYNFLDNLLMEKFETDVTGFSGSMAVLYNIFKIPYTNIELNTIDVVIMSLLIISLIVIINSKNKLKNIPHCIISIFIILLLLPIIIKNLF